MKISSGSFPVKKNIKPLGSFAERQKQADRLSDDCFSWALKTLSSKNLTGKPFGLTQKEVGAFFAKKYSDVKLKVVANQNPDFAAVLGRIFDVKDKFTGFVLSLGFSKNSKKQNVLDDSEKIAGLFHEHRHFCDFILNPKFTAKKVELRKLIKDENKKAEVDDFYNLFLYHYTLEDTMRVVSAKDRSKRIKNQVREFFRKQGFSSKEEIAILQDWRHGIKTEINATKDEFRQYYKMVLNAKTNCLKKGDDVLLDFSENLRFNSKKLRSPDKIQKLEAFVGKMYRATISEELVKHSFYPQKLKVLESLLASEIKSHRKEHATEMALKK